MDTKHTPTPREAREGDTLNPERPWGIVKPLTDAESREIDGVDFVPGARTVVIAEVLAGNPGIAEADAKFIETACNSHDALVNCAKALERLLGEVENRSSAFYINNAKDDARRGLAALKAAGVEL